MNIKNISIILLVAVILGVVFYWYEYRPAQIRKICHEKVVGEIKNVFKNVPNKIEAMKFEQEMMKTDYESLYKQCLRESGLEK